MLTPMIALLGWVALAVLCLALFGLAIEFVSDLYSEIVDFAKWLRSLVHSRK